MFPHCAACIGTLVITPAENKFTVSFHRTLTTEFGVVINIHRHRKPSTEERKQDELRQVQKPWIWISFDNFLPIFAPTISIIEYIHLASCLDHNSRFTNGSCSTSHFSHRISFNFPVKSKPMSINFHKQALNLSRQLNRIQTFFLTRIHPLHHHNPHYHV